MNDSGRACALTLINFMFAVSIWHRHKNRAEECLLLCRCLVTVGETMIVAVQLSSLCVFPSHQQRKRKNIDIETSNKTLWQTTSATINRHSRVWPVHATTRSLMGIPASANANVAWARLETRCTECELRGFSWCPCLAYDSHDNFGS